ncbi:MAG: hypothetical protein KDB27_18020 [Planctomycetales bacterium]|nr:hypothetical protein [Planctomycetales bacterium]
MKSYSRNQPEAQATEILLCDSRDYSDGFSHPSRIWRRAFAIVFVFGLIATFADHGIAEDTLGTVVEVKRNYCKVRLSMNSADGIQKGGVCQVVTADTPSETKSATVTAVRDGFAVVRLDDGTASVGDRVVVVSEPGLERDNPQVASLVSAAGKKVDVKLIAGRMFENIELLRVDDSDDQNIKIRVRDASARRPLTISLTAVDYIKCEAKLIFECAPGAKTANSRFSRKQALLAKQHAEYEAKLRQWELLLDKTGAKKWPDLTTTEHEAAITEHRDFIKVLKNDYSDLELYETDHFLFLSNIERRHLNPYLMQLDAMHKLMMHMYGIPEDIRVWKGKALIVAFVERQQFVDFERRHIKQPAPAGAYGVCHAGTDGQVIVACFRGDRPAEFGQMLVHETSHGFMHRYKTAKDVPSWINEGLADHLGLTIVPASQSVPKRQQAALERIRRTNSLGGIVGSELRNIRADQYGLSSLLVRFLIQNGDERFASLIDHLKAGLNLNESLQIAYNTSQEQMIRAFGVSIGMPNLQP